MLSRFNAKLTRSDAPDRFWFYVAIYVGLVVTMLIAAAKLAMTALAA